MIINIKTNMIQIEKSFFGLEQTYPSSSFDRFSQNFIHVLFIA